MTVAASLPLVLICNGIVVVYRTGDGKVSLAAIGSDARGYIWISMGPAANAPDVLAAQGETFSPFSAAIQEEIAALEAKSNSGAVAILCDVRRDVYEKIQ